MPASFRSVLASCDHTNRSHIDLSIWFVEGRPTRTGCADKPFSPADGEKAHGTFRRHLEIDRLRSPHGYRKVHEDER